MSAEPRQKREDALVLALARGESIADAARLSGWSQRTIQRRLADPDFSRQVRDARADMIGRASARLADATDAAVQTLRDLLSAESESVRLSASRSILELACRLRDSEELEARVAELEAIAHETHGPQIPYQVA
ncbi:MAG: hypothetical protein AB7U20_19900 [Planctomycetaceae bacterium]